MRLVPLIGALLAGCTSLTGGVRETAELQEPLGGYRKLYLLVSAPDPRHGRTARELRRRLFESLRSGTFVVANAPMDKMRNPASSERDALLLHLKITQVRAGDKGARYFMGGGAGEARVAVEGALRRMDDRRVIGRFNADGNSRDAGGGDDLETRAVSALVEHIARFLDEKRRAP